MSRKRMEAGIREVPPNHHHPKKRYQARVNHAGRRYERTFDRLADARRWRDATLTDLRRDVFIDERLGRTLFRDVAASWLKTLRNKKPKTRAGYEQILRRHLLPAFGSKPIGKIRPSHVQTFINQLQDQGAKPGTVRNVYRTLTPIFRMAVKDGLIAATPCSEIELPSVEHEEMHFLSPEEIAALADEITTPFGMLVTFAAYTGLRAGELAALQVKHLDFLRRKVHVVQSVSDVNGKLHYVAPKSKKSRRAVPLPAFLVDLLAAYLEEHPKGKDDFVFGSPEGRPLRQNNFMGRHFKPAVRRLAENGALPEDKLSLRFHDLRHTFAALLIAQGAHPVAVQQRMGHSSAQVSMDKYGHLFPSLDEKLTDGLDAMYQGPASGSASASG